MRLDGSTVLLTGATGGIGGAIARALHARGAVLQITARRAEMLEALCQELGERVEPLPADLTDRNSLEDLIQRAGSVDVLVANAALPASGRIDGFTPEEIDRALDVNLRAPIQLTRAVLPEMLERRRGRLVFVSSIAGKVAAARISLYSATKFGLRAFAAGLREDLHDSEVGVTTVFPGFISDAGMFADTKVELPRAVGTRTSRQVAQAVVQGIEQEREELDVAPMAMRAVAVASAVAPTTLARVQRRLGSHAVADEIAKEQTVKR